MKKYFLNLVFGLLMFSAFGQSLDSLLISERNPEQQNLWQRFKYDGVTAYQGMKYAYSRPFHWDKNDVITAGAFVASELIIYSADTDIRSFFREQNEHAPQVLKEFGWYYGSPQNNYMAMGGVYLVGLFTNNQKIRRTGVLMITSASAAGLIQTISKNAFGRSRPDTERGKHYFKPFSKEGGDHSFPSGHAILSFTMAHALAKQFDNIWIKGGIYSVGLIAPVSRLWADAHWASDVGAGIFISIVTVNAVDKFLFKEEKYNVHNPFKEKNKINWHFKAGMGTFGVVGTF